MNIGTTIKQMRKQCDLTQEQLAEALGISISAVSQWEVGQTMPDISMLAPLAYIFNVTTDELLGVEQKSIDLTVRQRTKQAVALSVRGEKDKMLALAEQTYKEFPHALSAISMYAWVLESTADAEHPERWDESIRISQKILQRSPDDRERTACNYRICKCYAKKGDKESALTYALRLPRGVYMNTAYVICANKLSPSLDEEAFKQINALPKMLRKFENAVAADPKLSKVEKRQHFNAVLSDLDKLKEQIIKLQTEET